MKKLLLDKDRIELLLRKADDSFFIHQRKLSYNDHIAHTAEYIAKHYSDKGGKNGN